MATSKEYLNFILDRLSGLDGITSKSMMGEYLIYYNGKILAYVCDNRFLVKPVPSAIRLLPKAKMEPPYDGAKDMILVENVEDRDLLTELFNAMYDELPEKRKR